MGTSAITSVTENSGKVRRTCPAAQALWALTLALAWLLGAAEKSLAQGVSFASSSEAPQLCAGEGVQKLGTAVLVPINPGTVVSGSSIIFTFTGSDLLGTLAVVGTGAGSITVQQAGNTVLLRYTANVAYAPGNTLSLSGMQMNTLGMAVGTTLTVGFSANSPSPANPIAFTAPTRPIASIISCDITYDSGNDQFTQVDTLLPVPFIVNFTPCNTNTPGTIVNFAVTQGGGTVLPVAVPVDANCKASATLRVGQKIGTNLVTARSAFAQSTVIFRATGVAGPAFSMSLVSGNSQTGTVGQPLPEPFVISVLDHFDNPTPRVPFVFDVIEGGGILSFYTGSTEAPGLVQTTLRLGPLPGTNRVRATTAHLPEREIIFTATAMPVVATNLLLNSGNNQTGVPGQPIQPFVVRVVGSNNIPIENAPVTFSVTAGGGSLLGTQVNTDSLGLASTVLTLGPNPGVNTVTASSGSLIGSPVTFNALGTTSGLAPTLFTGGMVNGASFRPSGAPGGSVAPGAIVALFGSDLASAQIPAQATPLPTTLGDTTVTFNGIAAPLFFVSPGQINAQVPWNISPGEVAVRIRRSFLEIPSQSFQLAAVSPGIFTANSSGSGLGAVLHADTFQPVTDTNPTAPNRRIAVFMTGLGPTNPPAVSGQPAPTPPATTIFSLLANIAGSPAPIEFSGLAPNFVGLYQVNLVVPAGTPAGNQELNIVINGVTSNTVTIPVL